MILLQNIITYAGFLPGGKGIKMWQRANWSGKLKDEFRFPPAKYCEVFDSSGDGPSHNDKWQNVHRFFVFLFYKSSSSFPSTARNI